MKRVILTPPSLALAALDELKDWLAITTTRDDTGLSALLRSAVEMCETFTGRMPLQAQCEEVLPSTSHWQCLATHPVLAVTGCEAIEQDGTRIMLAPQDYAVELEADGSARIRILRPALASRFAVIFTAGMGADWPGLPEGLRHGILRLAAHNYRQRDLDKVSPVPPAAIAALWHPWRLLRLM